MNGIDINIDNLPDDPAELKNYFLDYITNLKKEYNHLVDSLKVDILKLNETIKIYQFKLFGRKSENLPKNEQPGLFNEAEFELKDIIAETPAEKIKITYERLKKRGKRPLPPDLPRVEKIIDLSDELKKSLEKEGKLVKIGEEISEKLEIIPQQVYVLKYIRYKYTFKQKESTESKIITAELPHQLIPQGIATASCAAFVFKSKFVDALPYYRQEKIFESLGISLSRKTMCNWQIYIYYNYLIRLIDLMKRDLKKSYLVGADETTVQVIEEEGKPPGGKSYMWVYRGYQKNRTILLFDYEPNRKGDNPKEYLEGYKGYLQTDGYDGYNLVVKTEDIVQLACWAHVRRKFFHCFKALKEANYPESKIILEMIQKLYLVEKKIREEKHDEGSIYKLRQEISKPIIEKIKQWLDKNEPKYPPKSDMGEAINYTLKLWKNLTHYLDDARLPIDNNLVENAIRPFVIGRKNWLFSYNENGANSSAAIYSLVETAKANGREPHKYLKELFEKIPYAKTDEDYEKLLPYYEFSLF
jgi:transposase